MDILIDMILRICGVATILLIWFRTNAVYEYFGWMPFNFFITYKNKETIGVKPNWVTFLSGTYFNFLTRLVICPKCFGIWVSICCCVSNLPLIPVAYIGGLYIYNKLIDAQNI
jgi:hypothetical protein